MKETMHKGTFVPFEAALDKGLMTYGSSMEQFRNDATKLLVRRRMYRANGGAVRDSSAGDAASTVFLTLMAKVAQHMIDFSKLTLHDVANYEMYLFFTTCLLGTATLRDQTYRLNLIDDVYMDEAGFICESIFAPLQLKVKASTSESGHLLTADVKSKEATLPWLIMVCAVRPMRALLHGSTPSKLIWGMSGVDNELVSKSAWASRIQTLSKAYLGSPRTGWCLVQSTMFLTTKQNNDAHAAIALVTCFRDQGMVSIASWASLARSTTSDVGMEASLNPEHGQLFCPTRIAATPVWTQCWYV
jgi:hypothetical protein